MSKPAGLGAPSTGARGAKIGIYGEEGTGKTEFVMTVTQVQRLLILDTEGRTQYYNPNEGKGFEVIYSNSAMDAIKLLEYAEELHKKGEKVAFAVDSFSSLWFRQQEVAESKGTTSRGTPKFSSWGIAKKPLKQLYARMYTTPVDCVLTMRAKPKYEQKGSGQVTDFGYNVPDTERGIKFAVDLVLELRKEQLPPGQVLQPKNFWAVVTKTSGPKENNPLPIGLKITNPSFAQVLGLRLSGAENGIQFRDPQIQAQLVAASITSVKQFSKWLQDSLKVDEEKLSDVYAFLKETCGEGWDPSRMIEYVLGAQEWTKGNHEK